MTPLPPSRRRPRPGLRPRRSAPRAAAAALAATALTLGATSPAAAAPGDATVSATSPVVTVADGGTATVVVRLDVEGGGALTRDVTVRWSTGVGTATLGADHAAASGALVFPAGTASGTTQELQVATLATAGGETTETVPVTLAADGAAVGTTATVVIDAHDLPYLDPALPVEQRVDDLLARMSLEAKAGQMTQAERATADEADPEAPTIDEDPTQIASLQLGSVLSGGGSAPAENTPVAWADMVDGYQQYTRLTPLQIPLVYGVDAVHGFGGLAGATVFPHNHGLGATRDPALVQEASHVTAAETRATGIAWSFAPCLCVARDTRWGRSYESFAEDPALVALMGAAATRGLQGDGAGDLAQRDRVMATAKHLGADGDTEYGSGDDEQAYGSGYPVDQGITVTSEADLERIDLAPYGPSVQDEGAGAVMPSYSSIDRTDAEDGAGEGPIKAHADAALLTGYLKEGLGFDGFVISDYNGIDQIPGDRASDVRTWVNAGGDMAMEPGDFATFVPTLVDEVRAGRIPQERVDDAVRRILTKKFELGLFERPFADRTDLGQVGSPEHRAVARRAVAASQVLLKDEGQVLPLAADAPLYVAGRNADDLGHQIGGWSLTWQGGSGDTNEGTTILEGIREVAPDAAVTFSADASAPVDPASTGVVVLGETPYSEGFGDVGGPQWAFDPADAEVPREPKTMDLKEVDRAAIDTVCSQAARCVVLVVSGRPLVLGEALGEIDALVASALPGTEGAGVADVLFGAAPFTGQLSHSWPRTVEQGELNVGDEDYEPLYPFGWGLGTEVASAPQARRLTEAVAAMDGVAADDPRTRELVGALRQAVQALVADPATGVPARAADRIARADVALVEGDAAEAVRLLASAVEG